MGVGEILRRAIAHVRVCIRGQEIMVFRKTLRTMKTHIKSNKIPPSLYWSRCGELSDTHAACDMFTEDETEAILMVDASNTFNSINGDAFLTIQKYYIHL